MLYTGRIIKNSFILFFMLDLLKIVMRYWKISKNFTCFSLSIKNNIKKLKWIILSVIIELNEYKLMYLINFSNSETLCNKNINKTDKITKITELKFKHRKPVSDLCRRCGLGPGAWGLGPAKAAARLNQIPRCRYLV